MIATAKASWSPYSLSTTDPLGRTWFFSSLVLEAMAIPALLKLSFLDLQIVARLIFMAQAKNVLACYWHLCYQSSWMFCVCPVQNIRDPLCSL
jgi:hypothetical protein